MDRLHNLYWEKKLGITTNGVYDIDFPDANHYATTCYATIHRVLEHLSLQPSDVFIDIGSGKGRVLCCAARYDLRKVIGVEVSKELCAIAEANLARMRGRRAETEVRNTVAQEFDYSEGTVFFLFNPFGPSTVEAVLHRIKHSATVHPLRIAYMNPIYDRIFADSGWLQLTEHWDQKLMRLDHSVSFYTTRS